MLTSREVDIVCGGSYRHVKDFCGDLDIIITHRDRNSLKGFYPKFVKHLDDMTVLRGDLVSTYTVRSMLLCQISTIQHLSLVSTMVMEVKRWQTFAPSISTYKCSTRKHPIC